MELGPWEGGFRARDAADLSWIHSVGMTVFERSTFGGVLDNQRMFAAENGRTCATCNGTGFDADDNSCARCMGTGFVVDAPSHHRGGLAVATMRCPACPGSGTRNGGLPCPTCKGEGYVVRHLAEPRPRERGEGSVTPDDRDLERYARVTRRLQRLPMIQRVRIASYTGPRGDFWGSIPGAGRLWSLYAFTGAGLALIRLTEKGPIKTHPDELLRMQVARTDRPPEHTALLFAARTQAEAQLRDLVADWEKTETAPR